MFLFLFYQISRVYVACVNLCYIIMELTPEVLLFAELQELLFLHIASSSPTWSATVADTPIGVGFVQRSLGQFVLRW